jgi:cytoskeleton protein RodZ
MDDRQGTFQTPNANAKIGQVLEKARKERGLTLEEVENATKIRKRYLAGLEREDFGALPDAVYAQGFLKTYANYLGLDGEELSRELKDRRKPRRERGIAYGAPKMSDFDRPLINPGELSPARRRRRRRRSISGATMLTFLVALLTLAAVVGSLYYVGRGAQISGGNPAPEEQAADEPAPGRAEEAGEGKEPGSGESDGSEGAAGGASQPDSLTVEVSVEDAPSWLSIVADGTLAYQQIA